MRTRNVHWVWLGSTTPDSLLYNIETFRQLDVKREYQYNLWIDRPWLHRDEFSEQGLVIHRVETAFSMFPCSEIIHAKADFYREYLGAFHNYPAASDILRYTILYSMGGIYLDADVEFKHSEQHRKRYFLQTASNQQAARRRYIEPTDLRRLTRYLNEAQMTGRIYSPFDITQNGREFFNGVLLASPRNKFLLQLLKQISSRYKTTDSYTVKREFVDGALRTKLTVKYSGPGAMMELDDRLQNGFNFFPVQDCFRPLNASGDTIRARPTLMRADSFP